MTAKESGITDDVHDDAIRILLTRLEERLLPASHCREALAAANANLTDRFRAGESVSHLVRTRSRLIDEVLTPDSSRFWPADDYQVGRDQDSFDKQYVRNHLQELVDGGLWDKTPPAPELPAEVVRNTTAKYMEAYERLTGHSYAGSSA